MTDSADLRNYIVMLIVIATFIILGLQMLVKPASIRENSIMYRYMLQRFFQYWDKEVNRTGKLTHKHIQIYGLVLVFFGILFLGLALATL